MLNQDNIQTRIDQEISGMASGGVRPVFEDFKPESEWQQDAQSHSLLIYVPGFSKQQLRVSTESRNVIRVRGERLVAGNKWSRFLQDFQVPENSEMDSIRARFQKGILNITIQKKSADKPQHLPPNKTTTDTPNQPAFEEEIHKEKQGPADVISERTSINASTDGDRAVKQDPNHGGIITMKETKKEEEEKNSISKELPEVKKAEERAKEKEREPNEGRGRHLNSSTVERYKKAVEGIGELNEERQLMVNMGAAVLVIVALSAYVTYKFVSPDHQK